MAFTLKTCVKEVNDCQTLKVYDTTGLWHAVDNPTGWNGPLTVNLGSVADAYVTITPPDGIPVEFNMQDFGAVLPNITDTPFVVTSTQLGMSGKLPYGAYTVEFRVRIVTMQGEYNVLASETVFLVCSLTCCMQKAFAKVKTPDCNCTGTKEVERLKINQLVNDTFIILEAVKAAASNCGDVAAATELADYVNDVCSNLGCGCS
jgi:hypothetical protein